jgi:uncharacterized membrane protein YozB (DUF420 family)
MNTFARIIAGLTFVAGVVLFIRCLSASTATALDAFLLGYYFAICAVIINAITFAFLIIRCVAEKNFKAYERSIILMLINIPVALFYYLWFAL